MTKRQRKHRLNASRRKDTRYPWVRTSDYFCIVHSERDWKAEIGSLFSSMKDHGFGPCEIGRVDCGIRFITSEVKV